jgi:ABC-2 type transport system ATP-binding protein
MPPALSTDRLTRKFEDRLAVDRLDLEVAEGEVFGFLGPNGAGKTTTVRLFCALLAPTSGRAVVAGIDVARDPHAVRRCVGILTETPGLYDRLSVGRNLALFAELYGVASPAARIEELLRRFDLWDRRGDAAATLSKGMRQKLAIARALVHSPKVVFLDEPTSALDPEAALDVRELIEGLRERGTTVFLCTHHLEDAERLCDRVAVFKTRLLAVDTPDHLRNALFGQEVAFELLDATDAFAAALRGVAGVDEVARDGNRLLARVKDPRDVTPGAVRALVLAGAEIVRVAEVGRTLADVYIEVMRAAEQQRGAA